MEIQDVVPPLAPTVDRSLSIPRIFLTRFTVVTNARELKADVIKSQDERLSKLLFLDSSLVFGLPQLRLALLKSYDVDKMKTNSIGAEVVYNLWWKKSLRDAFKYFGINDNSSNLIVLGFGFNNLNEFRDACAHFVHGEEMVSDAGSVGKECDEPKLRKLFQVASGQDTLGIVMERMALRDIL